MNMFGIFKKTLSITLKKQVIDTAPFNFWVEAIKILQKILKRLLYLKQWN